MPIYEYRCDQCGNHIEVIQKFSDNPLERCEVCQGHLTKLISQTSFQLKGTGWYVTDYARKSGSPASTKSEKAHGDASKSSASKPADTKAKESK